MIRQQIQTSKNGLLEVKGRFRPNGTSAIDNTLNKGYGWTVAYSSTKYTLTFTDVFQELICLMPALSLNAADDKYVKAGTVSVANKTAEIHCWDVSDTAVAAVASNANNWIHFHALLKMSNS
jgi:hypothetical protein